MARPSQRTRIGCSLTRCTNTDVWVMGRCVSDPSASQILAPATVSNTIRRDGMAKRTRNNGYRRLVVDGKPYAHITNSLAGPEYCCPADNFLGGHVHAMHDVVLLLHPTVCRAKQSTACQISDKNSKEEMITFCH
jgi:hypothetical protein